MTRVGQAQQEAVAPCRIPAQVQALGWLALRAGQVAVWSGRVFYWAWG